MGFAKALAKWVKAGRPIRDDSAVADLFKTCKTCEHYFSYKNTNRGKCKLCGCQLNLGTGLNKLRWATEKCPANKWQAWVDSKGNPTKDGEPRVHQISTEPAPAPAENRVAASKETQKMIEEHQARNRQEELEARRQGRERRRLSRAKRSEERAQRRAKEEANKLAKGTLTDVLEQHQEQNEQERQQAKKDRREARQAKRNARQARRAAEEAALSPEQKWENPDPLQVFDRNRAPATLKDLWRNCSAFYVCGGPSLRQLDLSVLRKRGVVSMGINNVAGYAPVRAMTFSDPPSKFHHGIFLDPALLKMVPNPKLKNKLRIKMPDGSFKDSNLRVKDCPNVFGYARDCRLEIDKFLTKDSATWGRNKKAFEELGEPKMLFTFYLGLRLLHYFGIRRVYMIGVDFNMDPEKGQFDNYAFKEDRWKGAISGNNAHYRKAQQVCTELRPLFEDAGFNVYNCNPKSHLTAFDYVPFNDAVRACQGFVPDEPFDLTGWYDKSGKGESDGQRIEGEPKTSISLP